MEVGHLLDTNVCLSSVCISQHTQETPTSNLLRVLVKNANPDLVPDLLKQNL